MPTRVHRLAIAICGAGHSGSTLLGFCLGSHPEVFYAGEAKKSLFLGDPGKPRRKRVCKICGDACRVWGDFPNPPRPDIYEALARRTGCPLVVDSSKDAAWIRDRAEELARVGVPQKRILLVRDGRAVVNSRIRKAPNRDPDRIIDDWIVQMKESERLFAEAGDSAIRLRYELLVREPRSVLEEVSAFLEVDFLPAMLEYERSEQHPLGGNTGTQSVVARALKRESELSAIPERSAAYYGAVRGGFVPDERWRVELSSEHTARFERRAGAFNEAYRWEGP